MLATRFSGALVLVTVITSAVELLVPRLFRDVPMTTGNARGTALVMLATAVVAVGGGMLLTARESRRAQLVWLGGLGYLLYNALFFAYGVHFNALFLLYAAQLSLAVWAVVTLLRTLDAQDLRAHVASVMPVRAIALYLAIVQTLFAGLWLKDVVPAILHNTIPAGLTGTGMITNPVQMTDFAFTFPLAALAMVWFCQRRKWGDVLMGAFLVYGLIEAISIATDQWFGHLSDPHASAGAVPLFLVLTLISLGALVIYLRHLRDDETRAA